MIQAKTRLRAVGNSLGLTVPREVVQQLGLTKGDELFLVQHEDGFLITAFDPLFAQKMAVFDDVRRKYRDSLRELSK
jgi:putative addiction module antidote